jgi:hypothetical protein
MGVGPVLACANAAFWSSPLSCERRELGELLPYQQGRSDRQFTRDPAVGDNAGLA